MAEETPGPLTAFGLVFHAGGRHSGSEDRTRDAAGCLVATARTTGLPFDRSGAGTPPAAGQATAPFSTAIRRPVAYRPSCPR